MAQKAKFDIQTLHAKFEPTIDNTIIGTDFIISNINDEDIQDAKSRFLIFNNLTLLESTQHGEVYKSEREESDIYINGVKVASEPNFMFNYNITSMNAQIKKALNRERSNVGRTAYSDTIKKILNSCKSDTVLTILVEDLQNRMYGNNKDETAWVDVATHAAKTLNKSGNVVFMTPFQRNEMTNQQLEILKQSGKKLIMVTDDVYYKIQDNVLTFQNIYTEYNDNFSYKFIDYKNLTKSEQKTFDLRTKIMHLLKGKFQICNDIKISETIRVDEWGGRTDGIYEDGMIIIRRAVLANPINFCGVLAHELGHHQHNYNDNSREFESDLTNILGYSIYCAITNTKSKGSFFHFKRWG